MARTCGPRVKPGSIWAARSSPAAALAQARAFLRWNSAACRVYLAQSLGWASSVSYVVVDCTAGADSFASGLFTRFDLTVLVAEPTRKAISVCREYRPKRVNNVANPHGGIRSVDGRVGDVDQLGAETRRGRR